METKETAGVECRDSPEEKSPRLDTLEPDHQPPDPPPGQPEPSSSAPTAADQPPLPSHDPSTAPEPVAEPTQTLPAEEEDQVQVPSQESTDISTVAENKPASEETNCSSDEVPSKQGSLSMLLASKESTGKTADTKPGSNEETSSSVSTVDSSAGGDIYHVKWIGWGPTAANGTKTGIVTQNVNGPCPLLSIVNILLLRGKLRLPEGCEVVSASQLLENLGEFILESVPDQLGDDDGGHRLDYEQNVNDAIAILPKLQTGLDVNVRFTGVSDFEYTPECIIFDLLNIPLYHGWLMDPQQHDVVGAVKSLTYNQLVEQIISQKHSEDSLQVSQSLIAQQFLEESASQLTYHGLCELTQSIKEGELAVFFRNNHFSAIYKEKAELFLLVTDQGFLKEPKVVWETLSSIDGDGHFVDEKFVTVVAPSGGAAANSNAICDTHPAAAFTSEQQIDIDLQLAKRLAEEDEKRYERETAWEDFKAKTSSQEGGGQLTDEELAQKLHQEELESLAAEQQQQQQQQQVRDSSSQGAALPRNLPGQQPHHSRHQPQGGGSGPATPPTGTSTAIARQPSQRSKNCVIL